jgi:hypothetical protein
MQEVFAGVKISTIFVQIKGTFKFDTPFFRRLSIGTFLYLSPINSFKARDTHH